MPKPIDTAHALAADMREVLKKHGASSTLVSAELVDGSAELKIRIVPVGAKIDTPTIVKDLSK